MNFLARLWPFRGGDMATAVTDDDFVSVPRRPLRLAKLLAAPEHPYTLIPPIPLAERQPEPGDLSGGIYPCCWWGYWFDGRWYWMFGPRPLPEIDTHWLPASVEVLPVRCYPPEI